MGTIVYGFSDSPFGEIIAAGTEKGICDLQFLDHNKLETIHELGQRWGVYTPTTLDNTMAETVTRVLFKNATDRLTIDLRGTEFQISVWKELHKIPFGQTASYQDIANRLGNPKAVRAVASAIAQNPIAMLIPCHRVIHSDGTIGEYHWGRELKQRLLAWEASKASQASPTSSNREGTQLLTINSSTVPLAEELSNDMFKGDLDGLF
ncbi:MAG: methylated-DNA--[protein]-cysteine S-methyltransferase [Prevotella sp.]|jgi:O-6-methylguanine DNA methyltransferase